MWTTHMVLSGRTPKCVKLEDKNRQVSQIPCAQFLVTGLTVRQELLKQQSIKIEYKIIYFIVWVL